MSKHYDIHCVDCGESMGLRLRNTYDGLHEIIKNSISLRSLHIRTERIDHELSVPEISLDVSVFGRHVDMDWLHLHECHELCVRSEYGEVVP